jgi:hypothetical protein
MIDEPAPRIPLLLKDSGASQTIPSSRRFAKSMSAYASGAAGQRTLIEVAFAPTAVKPLAVALKIRWTTTA